MSRIVLGLLLAALFVWHAPPADAAADPLTMSVRLGFDGLARVGTWLPIELEIENRGPDIAGVVEVRVTGNADRTYRDVPPVEQSTAAVLPRYSRKHFVLAIFVPSAAHKITAKLTVDGSTMLQREVPVDPVPSGELLCGMISRSANSLGFLPSITLHARHRNARIATLELADIPALPQVLSSLDCLIMGNLGPGFLSEQQQRAVQGWVASGGLLVVIGGPTWRKTADNLPEGLLPVRISGTAPLSSADSLSVLGKQRLNDPGPWLASTATVTDGAAVASEEHIPLLVGARRGEGVVFYLALDPADEPLKGWSGSAQLWRYILSNSSAAAASPSSSSRQYSGWGRAPRAALADFSSPPADHQRGFALVASLYSLILVPAGLLVLRRTKKSSLSILLAAFTIAGGGAGSFAYASSNRNADLSLNRISIIHQRDDGRTALAHAYVTAFAPDGWRESLTLADGALVQGVTYPTAPNRTGVLPTWALQVQGGESPTVRDFSIDPGSVASFAADGTLRQVPLTANLAAGNGELSGVVANHLPQALHDAVLIAGGQVVELGDLPPNQARALSVNIPSTNLSGYMDITHVVGEINRAGDVGVVGRTRADIVESALDASYSSYSRVDLGAVSIVGWLQETPLSLEVRQTKASTKQHTLLIANLPIRLAPGDHPRLPSWVLQRRPMSVSAGTKFEARAIVLNSGESLSTEYTLPVGLGQFKVSSLAIDIAGGFANTTTERLRQQMTGQPALGAAQVFDWQRADWIDVPLAFGENVLPDPARFISDIGVVRVRYTYRAPSSGTGQARLEVSRFDISVGGRAL